MYSYKTKAAIFSSRVKSCSLLVNYSKSSPYRGVQSRNPSSKVLSEVDSMSIQVGGQSHFEQQMDSKAK